MDAATLLAWIKGPLAGVDLADAQVSGLALVATDGPFRGAFALREVGTDDAAAEARARRLAALACGADRPGPILGIAEQAAQTRPEPQLHESLLALKLQRRDCEAASALDDRQLCQLVAVERSFERAHGPLPAGPPNDFLLTDSERRQPSVSCAAFG